MSSPPTTFTNPLPLNPKIKVVFRGFVISNIRHGMNEDAVIGALSPVLGDIALCHRPIVHVYRVCSDDSTEIWNEFPIEVARGFSLRVGSNYDIGVFQKDAAPFNRLDEVDNDKKDFRWWVDFNDLHNRKNEEEFVEIDRTKLSPEFKLNRGVFHSSKLSDGEVKTKLGTRPQKKRFGRFSMEITARILIQPDEIAVFKNGTRTYEIRENDNYRYEILFDCTCRSADELTSDFGLVYCVIRNQDGQVIDPEERISMHSPVTGTNTKEDLDDLKNTPSRTGIRCTPEAYCQGGNG